jgi:ADP-ribosyltransferase exoenzyme
MTLNLVRRPLTSDEEKAFHRYSHISTMYPEFPAEGFPGKHLVPYVMLGEFKNGQKQIGFTDGGRMHFGRVNIAGNLKEHEAVHPDPVGNHMAVMKVDGGRFAVAAHRYTSSSALSHHVHSGVALPDLVHDDLDILSKGLRHPSLALKQPTKTMVNIRDDYDKERASPVWKMVDAKPGAVFHTHRFMSSTLNPNENRFQADLQLHIHLPAGYNKGAYVGTVSAFPSEHELLLDRDQRFRKIATPEGHSGFTNDGVRIVHLEPYKRGKVKS